jgi:hypothetical protein
VTKIIILFYLILASAQLNAQDSLLFHEGTFKKNKLVMSSNPYRPDSWERSLYEQSIRTAFPMDLLNSPDTYRDKLLLMIGIVDSVTMETMGDSTLIVFRIENKYWDFLEDYSIQDEVMFVSPEGGGKFTAAIRVPKSMDTEFIKSFASEKKLLFIYGTFHGLSDHIPLINALGVKWVRYFWYSTRIFSYEVERGSHQEVLTDKKGHLKFTNFHFLTIAHAGQNK